MSNDSSRAAREPWSVRASLTIQTVATGLLLYLVPPTIAAVSLMLILQLFGMTGTDIEQWFKDATLAQFLYVFITETIVILSLVILMKVQKIKAPDIGLKWPNLNHTRFVLSGFLTYYIAYIILAVIAGSVIGINLEQEQEIGFNTDVSGLSLVLAGISLVVLPPLVEEILFRGYLYNRFRRVLTFGWSALLLSLLFGAAHLQLGSGNMPLWIAAIDTFVLSLVLVYIREKTGTIWAGVTIHALKNMVAFVILFKIFS